MMLHDACPRHQVGNIPINPNVLGPAARIPAPAEPAIVATVNHSPTIMHRKKPGRRLGEATDYTRSGRSIAVRCVETGEEFDRMTGAADSICKAPGQISTAVKTGRVCGGYHWEKVAPVGAQE